MEKASKGLTAILADLRCSSERSTMFWWMFEHHDAIVDSLAGQRIRWVAFCAHLIDLGLKDRGGNDPNPSTARLTWHRARKAVQAEALKPAGENVQAAKPRPMPRALDARPRPAEAVDAVASEITQLLCAGPAAVDATELAVMPDVPRSRSAVDAGEPDKSPMETGTNVALARPTAVQPVWTPEQIAHRDAVLASARAQLDHTDRFIRLKE